MMVVVFGATAHGWPQSPHVANDPELILPLLPKCHWAVLSAEPLRHQPARAPGHSLPALWICKDFCGHMAVPSETLPHASLTNT